MLQVLTAQGNVPCRVRQHPLRKRVERIRKYMEMTEEKVKQIEALQAYEVLEHRYLEDLHTDSWQLRHKKSGARIALLSNQDENKVFYIGFRTPPADSTGVAHIIEHTVLCGSRDFPVKDPFIELVKGSLNTFLNAMTYPDKTVYPVASCNDTDFKNLMHVYLDAVFYPRIYQEPRIFQQEGWHYEAEKEDGPVTINGVVYNEMKGALSSPDDLLSREIFTALYPDTPYAVESGGDPENIPDLTYENYLDFHRRYYHPSNSYIYMYGNMDMAERLTYLDEAYLSHFDRLTVDSEIPLQPAFAEPVHASKEYSIMEDEEEAGNAYLSYNVSLEDGMDAKKNVAFKVLDYCLCEAAGAPVKEALLKKGIGRDVYSLYEEDIRQPCFSIVSRYTDADKAEVFAETIRETLQKITEEGFDEKLLLAGINYHEFRFREADYGTVPKGLEYGLDALGSWLYEDTKPWLKLELGEIYGQLRREVGSGYFEQLVKDYLLDNKHLAILTLAPKKGLTEKKEQALKARIDAYVQSLSEEQRKKIVEDTESLRKFQQTPDTPEDLQKIPMLTRADLKRECQPYVNAVSEEGNISFITHDLETNGICYVRLLFNMQDLPQNLYPYMSIFKGIIGEFSTAHYGYGDLNNEIQIYTGGLESSVNVYTNVNNREQYRTFLEINTSILPENLEKCFALLEEILLRSRWDEKQRLREILEEERSSMKSDLLSAGHTTAANRACAYMNASSAIIEDMGGISAYRLLCHILENYDTEAENVLKALGEIAACIYCRENLTVDITAPVKLQEKVKPLLLGLADRLYAKETTAPGFVPSVVKKNEGFATAGQVQYVCRAGNFADHGLEYTGALRVLRVMLGYDYLWNTIRVKGGAYGCMSSFCKDGTAYLVSYRDPHLQQTVQGFLQAAEYVRSFQADERVMTQYIIGAVSGLDHPMSAYRYGRYSLAGYLTGSTQEMIQKERDQVLDAQPEKIRELAAYLDAVMEDECFCVVGSAAKIEANKEKFMTVEKIQ